MNAFISYSISENEQYILTLLAQKLAENNITLVTSYSQLDSLDWQTTNNILNAALFIGLITKAGRLAKTKRVYQEFNQAHTYGKPAILLVENNVPVTAAINSYTNTIRFNRHFPNEAIEQVKNKIAASQTQPNPSAAAWILAGIGVLALLSWLSDDKK